MNMNRKIKKFGRRFFFSFVAMTLFSCNGCAAIGSGKENNEETDFRVLIASDIHYTTLREWHGLSADERAQLWVDAIFAEHMRQPIDLIIINGDVSLDHWISGGSYLMRGFSETKIFMEKYVSQLREIAPVITLPGNHEQFGEAKWKELTGNSRSETYVLGNNLFIMPDSYANNLDPEVNHDGNYSFFDTDEIKKVMKEYPNHNVYIISHYIDMSKQKSAFFDLLKENDNIIGLFSGHTHSAYSLGGNTYAGKTIAETGNFCYTKESDVENNFWGFRDLIITKDHATSRYITAECDALVEGKQVHYARKEINVIEYY